MTIEYKKDLEYIAKTLDDIKLEMTQVVTISNERFESAKEFRTDIIKRISQMGDYCQKVQIRKQENSLKIWLAIIGLSAAGLVSFGQLFERVAVNTKHWESLENRITNGKI